MDMHGAKLETLKNIIEMMTGHMLGGAAKHKKPAEMAVTVETEPQAEAVLEGKPDSKDDLDDDTAKRLMEMYGKDDDEDKADRPANITGSY